MNRAVPKHAEELSQERVAHRAQSPTMVMAFRSQCPILLPAYIVSLNTNPRPVIDSIPKSLVAGLSHHDRVAFTASLGHRRDAGISPQSLIVKLSKSLESFGEQGRCNEVSDSRHRKNDGDV